MRAWLVALNLLLAAAIVGAAFFWHPAPPAPTLAPAPTGGDFELEGPQGPVALRDFRGKLVLLQFGYTYCPDICPTALMEIAQAFAELSPDQLARVQAIFVSVDPERDDVARLREYTAFFHPNILGLTGPLPRIRAAAERFGAVFSRQDDASAGGYVIDHSALTYVIDPAGKLVAALPHATPASLLAQEIRNHLPPPRKETP